MEINVSCCALCPFAFLDVGQEHPEMLCANTGEVVTNFETSVPPTCPLREHAITMQLIEG